MQEARSNISWITLVEEDLYSGIAMCSQNCTTGNSGALILSDWPYLFRESSPLSQSKFITVKMFLVLSAGTATTSRYLQSMSFIAQLSRLLVVTLLAGTDFLP